MFTAAWNGPGLSRHGREPMSPADTEQPMQYRFTMADDSEALIPAG